MYSGCERPHTGAAVPSDPRPRAVANGDHLLLVLRGINNNAGAAPEDILAAADQAMYLAKKKRADAL